MSSPRKIFVNLAVRDLRLAMQFFARLGFEFDPKFTDDRAACMIVSPHAFVMLLTEPFFESFIKNQRCDTSRTTEGLFALSCDGRAEVDRLLNSALDAGGRRAMDAVDHGFMYAASFFDLDGHHWELVWMDPAAAA